MVWPGATSFDKLRTSGLGVIQFCCNTL